MQSARQLQEARLLIAVNPHSMVDCLRRLWTPGAAASAGALLFLFLTRPALADIGWYTNEPVRCQGANSLGSVYIQAGWFKSKLDLVGTAPAAGKIHIRESATRVQKVASAGGALVIDTYVFDAESAKSFRSVLQTIDDAERTPYIVEGLFDYVVGAVTSPALDLFMGFIKWLTDDKKVKTISFDDLAGYVAAGGILERTLAFYGSADRKRYALLTDSYRVAVGTEQRTMVLSSCMHAVETIVKEFRTKGQLNNKLVRPQGNRWVTFDITSNHNDPSVRIYKGQDEEFYYFDDEDDGDQHRISFRGGKWQLHRTDGWKTLYDEVDPG
jgi:hypothetical protein